jgi:hypothetical protein
MAQLAYAVGSPLLAPARPRASGPPRAMLVSEDQEFVLAVNNEGFDLQYTPIDGSAPSTSFAEFGKRAAEWLGACLNFTGQAAHRMSAFREHLLLELVEEDLVRARVGLLHVPSGFGAVEPFQWDFRIALERNQEIGGEKEPLFIVPTMKRIEAGMNAQRFDALLLSTDLNTSPKQVVARFKTTHAREFFGASSEWHDAAERAVLDATGLV